MPRTLGSVMSALLITVSLILVDANGAHSASTAAVSPELIQKAQSNGQVRVIVELAVSAAAQLSPDSDIVRGLHRAEIVQARNSVRSSLIATQHSVVREYQDLPFIAIRVGIDGLRTLESLQGVVARVVEDKLERPSLAQSTVVVQATQVWAGDFGGTPFDGSGTVIAILDSGVDKNHPFLAGKVVEEACFSSNEPSIGGTSFCPGGVETSVAPGSGLPCNAAIDGCDHGTHVAGIAAGRGSSFSGVARGANLMAVQVFTRIDNPTFCESPDPCISAFNSDTLAALEHVFARRTVHNIASINMSLAGQVFTSHCDSDVRKSIIDQLRSAGVATVISSGNESFVNAISVPSCISSAISVGSTGDGSDGATLDVVSPFSNSASFLSVLAPGALINSSVTPGNGFANFQGTSMAAPHVAGAIALFKQAGSTLTVSNMLSALQNTGVPVTDTRHPSFPTTRPRIRILNALFDLPLGDTTAPGQIADLTTGTATQTSVILNWTAPGDDGDTGTAAAYDVRYSNQPLDAANFAGATPASNEPAPGPAGTAQVFDAQGLQCAQIYYFALTTADEVNNTSAISNVVRAKTAACNKLAVSPRRLPVAEQNVLYNSGPISITNGAPPYSLQVLTNTSADISYDPASGSFKGTPSAPGIFRITGIASDAVGSQKKASFSGKINNPVQITTNALRDGKVGVPYRTTFKAKYGVKPYEWEVIPGGLLLGDFQFDKTTGKTTLVAMSPGTVDLNIKVKSLTGGTANQNLTLEFK